MYKRIYILSKWREDTHLIYKINSTFNFIFPPECSVTKKFAPQP